MLIDAPERACNYGWHVRGQSFAGLRAHASATLAGIGVVQPPGTAHDRHHVDYSQTLRLVRRGVWLWLAVVFASWLLAGGGHA